MWLCRPLGFQPKLYWQTAISNSKEISHLSRCIQRRPNTMAIDVSFMRKPYGDASRVFDIQHLAAREPFGQFKEWFNGAVECKDVQEANAMCLATATKSGFPSARMVLLKEFSPEDGFVFYTNYGSRKANELAENPRAALMFYWEPLKRSIRVEGHVEKVSEEKSKQYFQSRPIGSQIGACVSEQSTVIKSRQILKDKEQTLKEKHMDKDGSELSLVEKPINWGGYKVIPEVFEFWQGSMIDFVFDS